MSTTHTHKFEFMNVTEFSVNPLSRELPKDEVRFTCRCGYYTTYRNGLEWHNAKGEIIPEGTP